MLLPARQAVEARELQFFVPEKQSPSAEDYARISISAHTGAYDDICTEGLSRVFVHPSSLHAQNATFRASNFVLYGERSLSGSSAGSAGRAFIRDVTEASPFALLFFGGRVEAQYLQGTATLDKVRSRSRPTPFIMASLLIYLCTYLPTYQPTNQSTYSPATISLPSGFASPRPADW